ncbi:hypothetical protein ACFXTO_044241 [Malus domestica]
MVHVYDYIGNLLYAGSLFKQGIRELGATWMLWIFSDECKYWVLKLDEISILSVLPACAQLGAMEVGKWIHMYSDKKWPLQLGFVFAMPYLNWLANNVFKRCKEQRLNLMHYILGLLSACSHAGLWNEKKEDADESRLKSLGSLLSSCTAHCNLEIAITAREHLSELEPEDAGNYVLLSNIHAYLRKWEDVSRIRKLIRSKRTKRTLGYSSIEVNNMVMEFVAGDDLKPFAKDIFHARAARF